MINEENINGFWFLPEFPDKQFNGQLSFGPDASPRLLLSSAPNTDLSNFSFETGGYTIWGTDVKGQQISLFGCNRLNIGPFGGGIQTANFNAAEIVFGTHIPSRDTEFFDSLRFSFDGLEDWINIWGHSMDSRTADGYQLSYKKPDDIPFEINENASGCISFWNNFPQINLRETEIAQDTLFKLTYRNLVSTTTILENVWHLQQLTTLFMFEQTGVKWVYAKANGREYRIFYRQHQYDKEDKGRSLFLLQFRIIQPYFETAISNWFAARSRLGPVVGILHANIGNSREFVHNNFLNIVQAVEAFHRRILQDTEELKKDNIALVTRLLDLIENKEDRQWLEGRLAYSYEPNLRVRLKELIGRYKEVLFTEPPTNKKVSRLISNIVEKRNYFTHYESTIEKKDNETMQLLGFTTFLKTLLAFCLLDHIGVPPFVLKENIYNRYRFKI